MTDHSITGKTVLITGGAKNLGGLIARDLAEHGAKAIAIHYNSAGTQADADATVAAVKAAGAEVFAFQGDLTTAGAVEKLFAEAKAARSEEHTSDLQSLMRISYAVFCLKNKINKEHITNQYYINKLTYAHTQKTQ